MHSITVLSASLSLLTGLVSAAPAPASSPPALEARSSAVAQCYTGTQFPPESDWLSYDDLWSITKPLLTDADSVQEIEWIDQIVRSQSLAAGLDERVVLAIIMQESGGSVRVAAGDGGRSAGIMQVKFGNNQCVNTPKGGCSFENLQAAIHDGIFGTPARGGEYGFSGLKTCYTMHGNSYPKALRCYNSWTVDEQNFGIALHASTPSYVSDIGNRLRGVLGMIDSSTCDFSHA